jgi:hypothetical protein
MRQTELQLIAMAIEPPNHLLSPDGQGQKDFRAENF